MAGANGGAPNAVAAVTSAPAAKNEMFSSRESFRMLSNELFELMKKPGQPGGASSDLLARSRPTFLTYFARDC